jgi:hypothetical protein
VTKRVVDLLEAIEINEEEGQLSLGRERALLFIKEHLEDLLTELVVSISPGNRT